MSDVPEATDWRKLREFAAVDLTKSFILSWHTEPETLLIDIDVFLNAEHPFYEKPRPREKVCIRPAIIEFPLCERLRYEGCAEGTIHEVVESIGHGAVTGLQLLSDGKYEISGDFGTVFIDAERPLLRLSGP